jgi:hypothetical protein
MLFKEANQSVNDFITSLFIKTNPSTEFQSFIICFVFSDVKKKSPSVVPRKRRKRNVSNWRRNFVERKKNVSPGRNASRR